MLYEQYENKMKKIAKAKKIYRLTRFPILGLVVAVTATVLTLTFTKGNITKMDEIPETFVYGVIPDPKASSFMSDGVYEYRKKGEEEWSTIFPRGVGDFEYRVKTTASNGFKYSKIKTYTVEPQEVEVVVDQTSVTYGEEIRNIKSEGLCFKDSISSFKVMLDDYTVAETLSYVDTDSVRIKSAEGDDVTDCYSIKTVKKEISVNKRNITVNFDSKSKIYDGEALTGDYSIKGTLAYSDTLNIDGEPISITEIDKVDNVNEIIIKNADDVDVTHLYNVTTNKGTLTINKRQLTLSSPNGSKKYDGEPLPEETFKVNIAGDGLAPNHELLYEFENENNSEIISNTMFNNRFNYRIVSKDNHDIDVSSYYNVTTNYGQISITKREISIASNSLDKKYDGNTFNSDDFKYQLTGDGISPNHNINVEYSLKDTSSIFSGANSFNFTIYDKEDETMTEITDKYYTVKNVSYGSFAINKRVVNITSDDLEKTYDGAAFNEFSSDTPPYKRSGDEFLPGHHLEIEFTQKNSKYVTSGVNYFTYQIKDEEGNNVDQYYQVTATYGSFKINTRNYSIKDHDDSKTYDGTPLSNPSYETSGTLADGDSLEYTNDTSITNVGTTPNSYSYRIVDSSGNDVTSNYNVTSSTGTLEVKKRPLKVTIPCFDSKVYDSLESSTAGQTLLDLTIEGSVADGQELVYHHFPVSGTNIGKYVDLYSYVTVRNTSTLEDVSSNYIISYQREESSITKRDLSFLVDEDISKVYDGYGFSYNYPSVKPWYQIVNGSVAPNDDYEALIIDYTYKAGSKEFKESFTGLDNKFTKLNLFSKISGLDVSSNYNINIEYDLSYQINRAPIAIKAMMNSTSKVYDDSNNCGSGYYSITSGELKYGDNLSGTLNYSVSGVDVGHYSEVIINQKDGNLRIYHGTENVTDSYDITFINDLSYDILKRDLHVSFHESEFDYDAQKHYTHDQLNYYGTTTDDRPYIDDDLYAQKPGDMVEKTYDSNDIKVYNDVRKVDVTNNYNITVEGKSKVSINKYKVSVTSNGGFKIYDSKEFRIDSPKGEDFELAYPKHKAQIEYYGDRPINVWDSLDESKNKNRFNMKIVDEDTGEDVTDYYETNVVFGSLEVAKFSETLYCHQSSKKYDGNSLSLKTTGKGTQLSHNYTTNSHVRYNTNSDLRFKSYLKAYAQLNGPEDCTKVGLYQTSNPIVKLYYLDDLNNEYESDSRNYQFSFYKDNSTISMEITKRNLTISTPDVTREYFEGFPVSEKRTISGDSLAKNDTLYFYKLGDIEHKEAYGKNKTSYSCTPDMEEVGEYTNVIGEVLILNAKGEDVTNCYNITKIEGKVVILPEEVY